MKRGDKILLSGFVAILLILSLVLVNANLFQDKIQGDFSGTYVNTNYNGNGIILNGTNLTGTYTSRVFDGTGSIRLNNLSYEKNLSVKEYLFSVDNSAGIWQSADSGTAWTQSSIDYNPGLSNTGAVNIINNLSGSLFVANGQDLWGSDDKGVTWRLVNDDINGAGDSNDVVAMTAYQNILYIIDGSEDVLKSTDSGTTFVKVNNTNFNNGNGAVKTMTVNSSGAIFVVDAQSDVWKSIDSGVTWILVKDDYNNGNANGATDMDSDSSNLLFILDNQDLWKSTDSGVSWTLVNDDFNGGTDSGGGQALTIDSKDYLYIADGSEDIYKSTDSGISFTKVIENFNGGDGIIKGLTSVLFSTNLSFQIKNCSLSDCSDGIFVDVNLNNINLTSRYFQYKTYFSSQDSSITPKLYNLSLDYTILDNVPPLISIISPQIRNYTNPAIAFNVSLNEEASSCFYSLDNWQTNYTMTKLNNTYFYHSNLILDGFYIVRFSCTDNFGNVNNTVTRNLALDSTAPIIIIDSPQNGGSYGYNNSLSLNFSVYDLNGINKCWYNLDNGVNISLPGCTNTSFNVSGNGDYILRVYVNDSFGLVSNGNSSFSVQIGAPSVLLHSPINDYLNNSNIEFRYTPSDVDLRSCELWGNFNGDYSSNQTNNSPLNGIVNSFHLNLSDGNYLWNIRCNDSQEHSAFNGNTSFTVDTTQPVLSISEPTGTKTSRTEILLSFNLIENNKENCWYNVYRGVNLEIQNTTINCSSQTSFNVTVDADFVINLYTNDSAGNSNYASSSFKVDTSTPITPPSTSGGSSGGGGGGGGSIVNLSKELNLEITPIETIMYPGEENSLELSVKNKASKSVNKCRIKSSEGQESWISTKDIKNIASGEIIEFSFKLTLPENAKLILYLECLEGNKLIPLKVTLVKSNLNVKISEISLEKSNQILIKYTAESDSNSLTDLIFSVYTKTEKLKEEQVSLTLVKGQKLDKELIIELGDMTPGLLKIAVTKKGEEKSIAEESILYGSKITGFAVDNLVSNPSNISIIIIVIIFFSLAGLIIRKIIINRRTG